MKYQKGIWIPEDDNEKSWSEGYESRQYKKLNLSGKLCLDIGAHVGIWTKRLSRDFDDVICFEPLPKHIDCHKKNCEGLNNVTLHQYALSDEEATTEMETRDFNSGQSSLVKERNLKDGFKVVVKTKTLDSFDLPEIDFIKMDVEGYEKEVIAGAKKTILKYLPKIYVEIWDKNVDSVKEVMASMGYSMKKRSWPNYLFENGNGDWSEVSGK